MISKKLNALTALRFFAALTILLYHSNWFFGFQRINIQSDEAVSIFFILSGFILTYVYPSLNTRQEIKSFLVSRFARIWPAHAVCFLIVFMSLAVFKTSSIADSTTWLSALANITMVQAWIPSWDYFFSFNPPSWSISTEFFFYLCFPILILHWSKTWARKLLLSLGLLLLLIFIVDYFNFPLATESYNGVTVDALIYISPLGRLFEFVVGMCTALVYFHWVKQANTRGKIYYTALEIIVVLLVIVALHFPMSSLGKYFIGQLPSGFGVWMHKSSVTPFAALLILVLALERGYIAKLLSMKLFVLLGEISYAMYLIHGIALRFFDRIILKHYITFIPLHGLYVIYLISIFAGSYAMWLFIERPARRFITRRLDSRRAPEPSSPLQLEG